MDKPFIPPFDPWHPDDPICDDGERAAREQDEWAERIAPGLMDEMERRMDHGSKP